MNYSPIQISYPWEMIYYTSPNGTAAGAGALIREHISTYSHNIIIALVQPPNYAGYSVTNGFNYAATNLVREKRLDPHRIIWLEFYDEVTMEPAKRLARHTEGKFHHCDLVTMGWLRQNNQWIASRPDWTHISVATFLGLMKMDQIPTVHVEVRQTIEAERDRIRAAELE